MSRRAVHTTLAVILLLSTTPVSSFERLGVTWINGLVSYRVNPNFPSDPDFDGSTSEERNLQVDALRCGANNWRGQSNADFRFNFLGRSTRRGFNLDDNVNNVSWIDEDGGAALAVTLIQGFGTTATDFDIVYFSSTNDDTNTWNVGEDPSTGQVDILGIATHEFGHALGLAHSDVRQATMFAQALERGCRCVPHLAAETLRHRCVGLLPASHVSGQCQPCGE